MKVKEQSDGTVMFWCSGCGRPHGVPTTGPKAWGYNRNVNAPTFTPSILVYETPVQPCCHSFVTDGKQQYLSDCTHALAGQTVEIIEWEDSP